MWIKVTKTNARREIKLWKRGKEKKGLQQFHQSMSSQTMKQVEFMLFINY